VVEWITVVFSAKLDARSLGKGREEAEAEVGAAVEQALDEPKPTPADVEKHTYAPSEHDAVYPCDYTGLPG